MGMVHSREFGTGGELCKAVAVVVIIYDGFCGGEDDRVSVLDDLVHAD
jgi:hypothetical protein